jgi:hypothetical protein
LPSWKIALKACNDDPERHGQNGPCFLYAEVVGNKVVLTERLTGPQVDLEALLSKALWMVKPASRTYEVQHYITEANHRATVVAPNLQVPWRVWKEQDDETASTRALEGCQVYANAPCMLVAINDRVLPEQPSGGWPTQPQMRVAYRGEFDPTQIPALGPQARVSPTITNYKLLEGPKALPYHRWGRVFLGLGDDIVVSETNALKACNGDPDRHGQSGAMFPVCDR